MKRIIDLLMVTTLVCLCSSQVLAVPTALAPDAGTSSLLLAGAFAGLTFARRFFR